MNTSFTPPRVRRGRTSRRRSLLTNYMAYGLLGIHNNKGMVVDTSQHSGGSHYCHGPANRAAIKVSITQREQQKDIMAIFIVTMKRAPLTQKTLPLQPSKAIMRRSYPPVMTHPQLSKQSRRKQLGNA